MKKLLYIAMTALAVTVAAGCSGDDDDMWNSFPESDSSLLTEINSGIADAYYAYEDIDWYSSTDNLNWEKRHPYIPCPPISVNDIWFRGTNILHRLEPSTYDDAHGSHSYWGQYLQDGYPEYNFFIASQISEITSDRVIDGDPLCYRLKDKEYNMYLKSIDGNNCTLFLNENVYNTGETTYNRDVIKLKRSTAPAITDRTKVFDSYDEASEFLRELLRERYGDTIWMDRGKILEYYYLVDNIHFGPTPELVSK